MPRRQAAKPNRERCGNTVEEIRNTDTYWVVRQVRVPRNLIFFEHAKSSIPDTALERTWLR